MAIFREFNIEKKKKFQLFCLTKRVNGSFEAASEPLSVTGMKEETINSQGVSKLLTAGVEVAVLLDKQAVSTTAE